MVGSQRMKQLKKILDRQAVTLYNLLLPIWLLVWWPSFLWIIIIPLNYVIDRGVFTLSAKKQKPDLENKFFRKHTWKLWLFGFLSDFIGSILLLSPLFIEPPKEIRGNYNKSAFGRFMNAIQFNPFSYFPAFAYTVFAVLVAGAFIFLFDKMVLNKTGSLTREQAKSIALKMAIFTAPYLYLVPSSAVRFLMGG